MEKIVQLEYLHTTELGVVFHKTSVFKFALISNTITATMRGVSKCCKNAPISFGMYVCPSFSTQLLKNRILCLGVFENFVDTLQLWFKSDKNNG